LRDHGWSYRELAEKAGIARSTVCRVAHGHYARVEARYVDKLLAVSLYDR
jgi:transcriptional regulator with XRE-family HTH domain